MSYYTKYTPEIEKELDDLFSVWDYLIDGDDVIKIYCDFMTKTEVPSLLVKTERGKRLYKLSLRGKVKVDSLIHHTTIDRCAVVMILPPEAVLQAEYLSPEDFILFAKVSSL